VRERHTRIVHIDVLSFELPSYGLF